MTAIPRNLPFLVAIDGAPGRLLNYWLCLSLLCSCLVFGGGGGWLGDSALQMFSLFLLLLGTVRLMHKPTQLDVPLWTVIAGILVLAVIQLTPLPAEVWQHLDGRAELARQMAMLGIGSHWQPLSLSPTATERSLLTILPGLAICVSVSTMSSESRSTLVLWFCLFVQLSLILEFAQIAGGPDSALRIYGIGSEASAGGFYANPNHFACVLAMTIPLSIALLLKKLRSGPDLRAQPTAGTLVLCMMAGAMLIALPFTGSRAGLALGALTVAGSLALLLRAGLGRRIIFILIAIGLVGLMLVIVFGQRLDPVLSRLNADPAGDVRWTMHATTLKAARHFGSFGSGLGTFVSAYQAVEPERNILPQYINHAHSDYHELWLEAGFPGIVLVCMFLGWYLWRSAAAWIRPTESPLENPSLARAASIAIAVVLVHSWIDYPLRNTATLALFGLCIALVSRGHSVSAQENIQQ